MNFRVGQKVVCVDNTTSFGGVGWHPNCQVPQTDTVYTIRALGVGAYGEMGLKLKEIVCCGIFAGIYHDDYFYRAARFRPLVENKSSKGMEILNSILKDAENYKVKETVE